ncbi:MAG: peptidoglycan DD-metalloendopeptidase family protein, partial [bacterium]
PGEFDSAELAVSPIAPDIYRFNESADSASKQLDRSSPKQSGLIVATLADEETDLLNPNIIPVARNQAVFSGAIMPDFQFVPVVDSSESIPYGKLILGNRMVVHDYVSYLGSPQDQVYSPAAGNVVKIIESVDHGFTVHISHGGNVFSILSHLERVLVHEGQPLDAGEQLASTRKMNNSEKGKLDWGVQMNGFLVNPFILAQKP